MTSTRTTGRATAVADPVLALVLGAIVAGCSKPAAPTPPVIRVTKAAGPTPLAMAPRIGLLVEEGAVAYELQETAIAEEDLWEKLAVLASYDTATTVYLDAHGQVPEAAVDAARQRLRDLGFTDIRPAPAAPDGEGAGGETGERTATGPREDH